jgi:hypothetical protein
MKNPLTKTLLLTAFTLPLAAILTIAQIPLRPIDQNRLQGHWEGEGAGGKCTITITGNTLRYQAGTNWHETTFTLPAGTYPQQLHATIKDSWPKSKDTIGTVVPALIKLENDTLTLAAYGNTNEPPKTLEEVTDKYIVKQVAPKKENPKPSKPE